MPSYKPLNYLEVVKILRNLGFSLEPTTATSHQTWVCTRSSVSYAVTVYFHGSNKQFPPKTLKSIIEQSGVAKADFYSALRKGRS